MQTGLVAALAEPVSDARACERLSLRCDKERVSVLWHALDGLGQCGRNRNAKVRLRLLLTDFDEPVFNVLPAHTDNVGAALAGVERKQQCETRDAALVVPI